MLTRRFVAASALALTALLTTTVVGANAQTTPTDYAGRADATALKLTLLGMELSAGNAAVAIDSVPSANAMGTGVLLGETTQGASSATVSGADGTDGSATLTCTPEDALESLTDALPLNLLLGVGCSSSQAAIAGGFPSATARGTVALTSANNPLFTLLPPDAGLADVKDLLAMLGDTVDTTAIDLLIIAAEALPIAQVDLAPILDALGDVIEGLDVNLVNLTVGDTTATSTATATGVVSRCSAAGAQLDILDLGPTLGGPQVSVTVGDSSAEVTATVDGVAPVAVARPSLVTIGGTLVTGLTGDPIEVTIGMPVEVPLPGIGTLVISAASGTTGVDDDGQTFATADGVRIELNSELLAGGVQLEIASCTAAARASAVTPVTTPPAPPTTQAPAPMLPRTGGDSTQTGALALLAGAAGLSVFAVRRRRV